MKRKKEIIIGLIGVATLAFAYWGFTFLKAKDFLSNNRTFIVVYDKIAGLTVSNPVVINGFKIGHVTDVYLYPDDTMARIVVKFQVSNDDIQIPKNSIAKIESDLLGVNKISLQFKASDTYAKSGDTLAGQIATTIQEEVNAQVRPIKIKAEEMMASLDSVLGAIRYIFNKETQQSLAKTFKSIKTTIENLESTTYNLDTLMLTQKSRIARILNNIEVLSYNLSSNSADIDNVINNLSAFSDSLATVNLKKTFENLDDVLNQVEGITSKINRGEGSLGLLANDDKLYKDLDKTVKELNSVLLDIKLNPHRYVHVSVFGRNPKKDKYQEPDTIKKK